MYTLPLGYGTSYGYHHPMGMAFCGYANVRMLQIQDEVNRRAQHDPSMHSTYPKRWLEIQQRKSSVSTKRL